MWKHIFGGLLHTFTLQASTCCCLQPLSCLADLVSFTPAALHLLTYIKMSSSCTNMLTTVMQVAADSVMLCVQAMFLRRDRLCATVVLQCEWKHIVCHQETAMYPVNYLWALMLTWNDSLSHYRRSLLNLKVYQHLPGASIIISAANFFLSLRYKIDT